MQEFLVSFPVITPYYIDTYIVSNGKEKKYRFYISDYIYDKFFKYMKKQKNKGRLLSFLRKNSYKYEDITNMKI